MTQLVFFLEEPSAREMLKGLLPKLLPDTVDVQFVVFEGKQDLEKRLPLRLRAWQNPAARFLVLRDQDSGDCREIKRRLLERCQQAGHAEALVRIACRELESFYLGDLAAVGRALGLKILPALQNKAKFRMPDRLGSPSAELKTLAPAYQKLAGSRAIGPELDPDHNASTSFRTLVDGVRRLCEGFA